MGRIVVPGGFEGDFQASGRFAGYEVEKADNLADAIGRLAEGSVDAVFLGGAGGYIDRATFEGVIRTFEAFARPVALVCAEGWILWENAASARDPDLQFSSASQIHDLMDPASKGEFFRSLKQCFDRRTIVRTIISRPEGRYELNLVPVGGADQNIAAVVVGPRDLAGALSGRFERLAALGPHLFPEDAESVVRLPHEERINLIKGLIERTVREIFEYDDFILRTLNHKTGALEPIIARSGEGQSFAKRVLYVGMEGNSVAGYVAATGKPYLIEDTTADPMWIGDLLDIQSAVVVPLKIGEKVMGTFAIEKKQKYAYDRYDVILASLFAGYLTAVLDMADLVGLGQRVMADRVAESVVQEAKVSFQSILDSVEELRRYNVSDAIAVTSRLENIKSSVAAIQEAITRGAKKVGAEVVPPAPSDEMLAGKRVLIADDEASILQSLGDILKGSGCIVDFARDGVEAVEMATAKPYDLVISDIKMPKMSGYEVYASIKSRFPSTPVILMTAYGYDPTHSIVRARQEGLEAVLYKPFRAETLKKTLKQAFMKAVKA